MKILIIGGGGREHALAWKCAQNSKIDVVYLAPGNAGSALDSKLENIDIDIMDFAGLADFAKSKNIELTIVGPEAPLVAGVTDFFKDQGLACFGPSRGASQLEGSKSFTKDFLARHNIPTADYDSFTDVDKANAYLDKQSLPIVIKADGLAAGKGVVIAETLPDAKATVADMLSGNAFGEAGCRVVIEEFLQGEEASFIVMVDGKNVLPMATSQDHKRVGDGDTGLNTGGMGAYSPAPVVTEAVNQKIMEQVIFPTVRGMAEEGNSYTGFLYAGLMIDAKGSPKVIEYNCRFGDPETQPIMMRLQSDLPQLCLLALQGRLEAATIEWNPKPAVGVVLAASGYPGDYSKGHEISGLENKTATTGSKVFHAGTKLVNGKAITNGGRVLCATALGDTISEAQKNAYSLAQTIDWDGRFMRTDIAYRAIEREHKL